MNISTLRKIVFFVGIVQVLHSTYQLVSFLAYVAGDPQYQVSVIQLLMFHILPLLSGVLLVMAALALKQERGASITSAPSSDAAIGFADGVVKGPNGQTLQLRVEEDNNCGFCQTSLPGSATVCSGCGAEKGIGRVGKLGIVNEGAVIPMRIIAVAGWLFVLAAFAFGGTAGALFGFVIGALMLAITLYNWRVLFWNGEYRWYRRGIQ